MLPHQWPGILVWGSLSFHFINMAQLHQLAQHSCERGDLTVFEKLLPGSLKRIYYIANADGSTRGGHGHHKAWQALICMKGRVDVLVRRGEKSRLYSLDKPDQCLVLEPDDWHLLENFQDQAIVLIVSNEYYDEQDYFYDSAKPSTLGIAIESPSSACFI